MNKKAFPDSEFIDHLIEKSLQTSAGREIRFVLYLGPSMVLLGSLLMLAGFPFAFDLTLMVWGSILTALALWLRSRALQAQTEQIRILAEVRERSLRTEHKRAFAERLWTDGIPEGSSIGDVLLLLDARWGSERHAAR